MTAHAYKIVELEMYKAKLMEELFDGQFSLHDICKATHILSSYPENKRCRDDKLWFSLIDHGHGHRD